MRHPSDWPADKETFSDDEMYFIVYAKHNHVPPWRCAEILGLQYGVVLAIYNCRGNYGDQVVRVGGRVWRERQLEPNNELRQQCAALFFPAEATLDDAMRKGGQE